MRTIIGILLLMSVFLLQGCGSGLEEGDGLSAESRIAAMDAVSKFIAKLPADGDFATNLNSVAEFLSKRSEFSATGVSDNYSCVWGRFQNGWGFVIKTDRLPSMPIDTTASAKVMTPVMRKLANISSNERNAKLSDNISTWKTRPEMPSVAQAKLFACLGTGFGNVVPTVRSWLLNAGYSVNDELSSGGTVEDLKTVQGDGIFYISTHGGGGQFHPDGGEMFCLTTGTLVTPENEVIYAEDLNDKSLVIQQSWVNNTTVERRYAITENFVKKYMKFGKNSFVYIDACYGDNIDFRHACEEAGASLYVSWTGPVYDPFAVRAAFFIFDRMLGANSMAGVVENPKQRPFDYSHVYTDLLERGWNRNPGEGDIPEDGLFRNLVVVPGKYPVRLVMTEGPGACGWLAPSIECLRVNESPENAKADMSEMEIFGTFGSDPGESGRKVEIEDQDLPVLSWTPTKIVCELPIAGPRSAGKVQVFSGNIRSNLVPLTDWWLTLRYKAKGEGSLQTTMDITCHLRYDVHGFRTVCGTPLWGQWRFLPNIEGFDTYETTIGRSSYGLWSAGGLHDVYHTTSQDNPEQPPPQTTLAYTLGWEGSGTIPYGSMLGSFSQLHYDDKAIPPYAKVASPRGIEIVKPEVYIHLTVNATATMDVTIGYSFYEKAQIGNGIKEIDVILDGKSYIKGGWMNKSGDNNSTVAWSLTVPRFQPDESTAH
ncbi:MAG: hypothetical protein WC975_00220 [Phycisphaerae bacterium]